MQIILSENCKKCSETSDIPKFFQKFHFAIFLHFFGYLRLKHLKMCFDVLKFDCGTHLKMCSTVFLHQLPQTASNLTKNGKGTSKMNVKKYVLRKVTSRFVWQVFQM